MPNECTSDTGLIAVVVASHMDMGLPGCSSDDEKGCTTVGLTMGIAWYGRLRRRNAVDPVHAGQPMLAIRRDWPGTGHDFVAFGVAAALVLEWVRRDSAYWRKGPVKPEYSTVLISRHDFRLHSRHRLGCRAPDCPQGQPIAVADAAVAL